MAGRKESGGTGGGGGGMKKVFCFVFLQFYRGGDCRFGFGQTNPRVRRKAGWREGRNRVGRGVGVGV